MQENIRGNKLEFYPNQAATRLVKPSLGQCMALWGKLNEPSIKHC